MPRAERSERAHGDSRNDAGTRVYMRMQAGVHRHEEASALEVQPAALISSGGSLAELMAKRVIRIPPRIYRYRDAQYSSRRCTNEDVYRGENVHENPVSKSDNFFCTDRKKI